MQGFLGINTNHCSTLAYLSASILADLPVPFRSPVALINYATGTNRPAVRQVNFLLGCLGRCGPTVLCLPLETKDTRLIFRSPFSLAVVGWLPPDGGIYTRVLKARLLVRSSHWNYTASMSLYSALTAVKCTSDIHRRTDYLSL